ncbi:MAG: ORF6N domain-containing protein [Planctomycetales bacterium]
MGKAGFLIPLDQIERVILSIRGQNVILDRDLAEMYDVSTKVLNQAVRRNLQQFPEDFMFQLNWGEVEQLSRSQIVTLKRTRGAMSRPLTSSTNGSHKL